MLVAATNAPPKPGDAKGLHGKTTKLVQKQAGVGTAIANRIILLRDADGDGIAEIRSVFLQDLNSPFGLALVGNELFIADSDAVRLA
jgi:glucose/arabinose dehydrogenase